MLGVCTTRTWWVDTGATNHVCNSLQGFQEIRQLMDEEICLVVGDATKVALVVVRKITLHFGGDRVI